MTVNIRPIWATHHRYRILMRKLLKPLYQYSTPHAFHPVSGMQKMT